MRQERPSRVHSSALVRQSECLRLDVFLTVLPNVRGTSVFECADRWLRGATQKAEFPEGYLNACGRLGDANRNVSGIGAPLHNCRKTAQPVGAHVAVVRLLAA